MGALSLLILLVAAPGRAAEVQSAPPKPFAIGGYAKEVFKDTRGLLDDRSYYLSTTRLRLSLDAKAGIFNAHADYDNEVLAGTYFRTQDYAVFGLQEPLAWLPMDQTISTSATSIWRHGLYRGWAGLETEAGVARFGRQRVAWGTGKFWNPTDVLNPFNPISIERDERRGVDAFYARRALGTLSQAELVWAPRDVWVEQSLLGRARTNIKDYDASLMGGKVPTSTASWMLGGDFAGNLAGGTLHGEWSYTDLRTRTPFWKADVGYDYEFSAENRLWPLRDAAVVVEYFHNGRGSADSSHYDFAPVRAGQEVTVARDYLGASYSKDLHPLLKLEFSGIVNLNDGSQFLSPSLQWNALKDFYLTGGWQGFLGAKTSEYGRLPDIAYGMAQFYF